MKNLKIFFLTAAVSICLGVFAQANITKAADLPDLVITDIVYAYDATLKIPYIHVNYKNSGTASSAGGFRVTLVDQAGVFVPKETYLTMPNGLKSQETGFAYFKITNFGTYNFTATIDTLEIISESNEYNIFEKTMTVAATAKPDLVINNCWLLPNNTQVSVDFSNIGNAAIDNVVANSGFKVKLYDKITGYTETKISYNNMQPSSSQSLHFSLTPGSYNLLLTIDSDGLIDESNEKNNTLERTVVVPAGKPDLYIVKAEHSPESPKLYQEMTQKVTVKNNGSMAASNVLVKFNAHFSGTATIASLGAGETKTVEFKSYFILPGNYNVIYTVDPNNLIDESSETNNVLNTTVMTSTDYTGDGTYSLLKEQSVKLSNGYTILNDNARGSLLDNTKVYFQIYDQNNKLIFDVPELSPGGAYKGNGVIIQVNEIKLADPYFTHTTNVTLKSEGMDEPNFVISDLKIKQKSGDSGQYIYVTVKNVGAAALPANKIVGIKIEDLDTGDIYNAGVTDNFVSGYIKEVSSASTIKAKSSNVYRLKATVDTENSYSESDENNNTFTKDLTIFDIAITDIKFSSPNNKVGEEGKLEFTVTNLGYNLTDDEPFRSWGYSNLESFGFIALQSGFSFSRELPTLSNPLKTKESIIYSWKGKFIKAGSFNLWFSIDSGNVLKESNENNNTLEKTIIINNVNTDRPDLIITDIVYSYDATSKIPYIHVNYKNSGTAASKGGFRVSLVDKNKIFNATEVYLTMPNGLKPGETGFAYFKITNFGAYNFLATIDGLKVISESNENNNTFEKNLTVGKGTFIVAKNQSFGDASSAKPSGVVGQQAVKIGSFSLANNAGEGIDIAKITIRAATTANPLSEDFQNLMLKRNDTGAQIGSTIGALSSNAAYNYDFIPSSKIRVVNGQTLIVDVYADILNNAVNVNSAFAVVKLYSVTATGAATASDKSVISDVSGQNVYLAYGGSLLIEDVASDVKPKGNICANTVVELFKFKLTASAEKINISRFIINQAINVSDNKATTADLKATTSITNFDLYDGTTKIAGPISLTATASMEGGDYYIDFNLGTSNPYAIGAGVSKIITLKGSINTADSVSPGSKHQFSLKINPLKENKIATRAITARGADSAAVVNGPTAVAIIGDPLTTVATCAANITKEVSLKKEASPETKNISGIANLLGSNQIDQILEEMLISRDTSKEQDVKIKYLEEMNEELAGLSSSSQDALSAFIAYGVDENTKKLGEGERAAVVNSYKDAFSKLPETEEELTDVIKIANGRFPSLTSSDAEKKAKERFQKIYKRIPDMNDANDSAAVQVMAYGLRQPSQNRNLESEKQGINTFKSIFGYTPKTTEDWNTMQAITYSGATRQADSDKDLLSDEMEAQYGTDKNNPDTDGDGFKDGTEVINGYSPLAGGGARL